MLEAETRFARAADGSHIAYQIVGHGPVDLVAGVDMVPIDSLWEDPELAGAFERLASIFRVILFDRRATGASDAPAHGGLLTHEESMQDIVAVMEAASSPHAVLLSDDSAAVGVLFATTSPDRVDGLVLINSYARLGRADDYPIGIPPSVQARYLQAIDEQRMDLSIEFQCRPRRHDAAFRNWHLKGLRRAGSPAGTRALMEQDYARTFGICSASYAHRHSCCTARMTPSSGQRMAGTSPSTSPERDSLD